ncbi:helix-turn-helix domain-containing protein [Maribellus sp. YY47]|uniref:helix-turn-helix transcriptional regulator n=1 Tax=Maribellus sp. YY47 TaxID=2929486 RepID=UPI002001C02D|nr:helix-turn-helix domain-containing protein [Maribellus sp. YY47]MCK3683969.1 helix-turn-helix domain-containing protein [Maribellus sp. YY47]
MLQNEIGLEKLKQLLTEQNLLQKEVLNLEEASAYIGISKSNLYKKTSAHKIPHYKPEGKLLYFKRSELDEWMLRNRQSSTDEIADKAATLFINQKGGLS